MNAVEVLRQRLTGYVRLDDAEEALDRLARLVDSSGPIGAWMAAALSDPSVCAEMKADIEPFLASIAAVLGEEG